MFSNLLILSAWTTASTIWQRCQTESYSCQVVDALVLKNEIWSSCLAEMKVPQKFVFCFCFFEKVVVLHVDNRSYPIMSILYHVFISLPFLYHFRFYICLHTFQFCLHMDDIIFILDGFCILGSNWMFCGYPQTLSVRNSPKICSTFLRILVMSLLVDI